MMKLLKNKKVIAVLIGVGLITGVYQLGKYSGRMSDSEIEAAWKKLPIQTQLEMKEMIIKMRESIKADVCK